MEKTYTVEFWPVRRYTINAESERACFIESIMRI